MNIYVYSDESGVFDYLHNEYYVFGGVILLGKDEKDACERKYRKAETSIARRYSKGIELKASAIKNADRGKLFRSVNQYNKFGVIIKQNRVHKEIFAHKKSKQRYLDYAYKLGVKNALTSMMARQLFTPQMLIISMFSLMNTLLPQMVATNLGKGCCKSSKRALSICLFKNFMNQSFQAWER